MECFCPAKIQYIETLLHKVMVLGGEALGT